MIDQMVIEAVNNALTSESVKAAISKAATDMVTRTVQELLSNYGPVCKPLREGLEQAIPILVDDMQFANFGNIIREVIKRRTANIAEAAAVRQLDEVFDRLLGGNVAVVTLEDIADAFREDYKQAKDGNGEQYFTMSLEKSGSTVGYYDLRIDPREGRDEYGSKYVIRCREADQHKSADEITGERGLLEVWHVTIGDKEYTSSLFTGPLFNFDAILFRLFTGMVKIRRSEFSTEWPNECHCD